MPDMNRPLAALRHPRATMSEAQVAAGGVAAGVRDAFRALRPDDLVQAVREGPAKAVRELEPAEIGRSAAHTRDAVLEAIAAVATEIARDPTAVPAAFGRLPRVVTDRIPGDVLERLPAPIAERVPAVRRRRRRRLVLRLAIAGLIAAGIASVVAVVLRRRAAERRQFALAPVTHAIQPDGLDPVPAPTGADAVRATDEPSVEAASGLPGMAPVDETRTVESSDS